MKSFKYPYLILFFAVVLNFVCSESPKQPQPSQPGPPQLPDLSLMSFTFPANAPDVVKMRYGEGLNDLGFTLQMFEVAKGILPIGKHPNWEWKAEFTPYQVTIKAKRLNGETVAWELRMDGGDPQRGPVLINWLAAEGTIQTDGSTGSFKMYTTNTTSLSAEIAWSKRDNGVLNIESEKNRQKFSYSINLDNSGNFSITDANGMKTFEATWNTSGAGSWISYDPATGQQTGNGAWAA